jgi:hypothetical protein
MSRKGREMWGTPVQASKRHPRGAEARFLLGALDAALKRRSSTVVRGFVTIASTVSPWCAVQTPVRLIRACGRAEVVLLVMCGENVHGG